MSRRIDDPLFGGHACELTCVGRILLQIHREIRIEPVKWREILDGVVEIRLCSAGRSALARG